MENRVTNKKYIEILRTGRELFWKHGFRRVSIEEICQQAGVSKMTFYRFFSNKIELAKAVFDNVVDEGQQRFRSILTEETTSAEKIKKMLLLKMEGTNDISREFLQDFYSSPELGLKAHVEEKTKASWDAILDDFKAAQEKGWFRKDMKPEFLFYLSQRVAEALGDEKLLQLYNNPQELVMEMTNFFAYGISPHE